MAGERRERKEDRIRDDLWHRATAFVLSQITTAQYLVTDSDTLPPLRRVGHALRPAGSAAPAAVSGPDGAIGPPSAGDVGM